MDDLEEDLLLHCEFLEFCSSDLDNSLLDYDRSSRGILNWTVISPATSPMDLKIPIDNRLRIVILILDIIEINQALKLTRDIISYLSL